MISTVFVVTPCLNSRATIDRTIQSVVSQAGNFRIRYHVKDGGSTDGTIERLRWWDRWLRGQEFPRFCHSIDFTYSSEADIGMYDAIIQGFSHTQASGADFMTWINADDVLLPGAIALIADIDRQFTKEQISWVGGSVCVHNKDRLVAGYDRYLPSAAIRAGACDGVHWDFVQQEGIFFRHWLWSSVDPKKSIRDFRLAGDWNLWRLFAQHASLVQWSQPLAVFNIRVGQLSATGRSKYFEEIDACVAPAERERFLETAGAGGPLTRRRLVTQYPDGQFTLVEEAKLAPIKKQYEKRFGKPAPSNVADKPDRILFKGSVPAIDNSDESPRFSTGPGFIAHDHDWQYPAITEQHAFAKIREVAHLPENVVYVAYPWATLIDKMQTRAKDLQRHLAIFQAFCRGLPQGKTKITVAQHIYARRYLHLFEEAGIDHVFWAHATKQDAVDASAGTSRPALHPFPLFPVQQLGTADTAATNERPTLYSFIGARADRYYPTATRNWIIDHLADDPRGQIVGRDNWHYGKVVYEGQVNSNGETVGPHASTRDTGAEEQFKASLSRSVFSLCPSGTGPNSIRLWESLGAGSIPVVLADSWAPPGNVKLWKEAVVFCEETLEAVKTLPDRLAAIAADPETLEGKRAAMRQLWLLYGPETFVYDVLPLLIDFESQRQRDLPGTARSLASTSSGAGLGANTPAATLRLLAAELLLDNSLIDRMRDKQDPMGERVAAASAALPADDPSLIHYRRVADWASTRADVGRARQKPVSRAPGLQVLRRQGPKIFLGGRHSHRTPLAYPAIRNELPSPLRFVDTAADADIVMTGFNVDLRESAKSVGEWMLRKPRLKLAVISEEPLWDVTWSGGYSERERTLDLPEGGQVPYAVINHETSSVFEFHLLPYFPLTTNEFPATYATRLGEYVKLTPDQLLEHWRRAPLRAAFFAERRAGAEYRHVDAEREIAGLSEFRTSVAENTRELWTETMCVGQGWRAQVRRQDLADWHLDKLAALNRRTRICSALENVHHRSYITEKIFDAFAVGAIPVYNASAQHRVLELVPASSMINTHGLTPVEAATRITTFEPDRAFAESWLETCARIRSLFADPSVIIAERRRIAEECLREIEALA
jgi:hypothetical protein